MSPNPKAWPLGGPHTELTFRVTIPPPTEPQDRGPVEITEDGTIVLHFRVITPRPKPPMEPPEAATA